MRRVVDGGVSLIAGLLFAGRPPTPATVAPATATTFNASTHSLSQRCKCCTPALASTYNQAFPIPSHPPSRRDDDFSARRRNAATVCNAATRRKAKKTQIPGGSSSAAMQPVRNIEKPADSNYRNSEQGSAPAGLQLHVVPVVLAKLILSFVVGHVQDVFFW